MESIDSLPERFQPFFVQPRKRVLFRLNDKVHALCLRTDETEVEVWTEGVEVHRLLFSLEESICWEDQGSCAWEGTWMPSKAFVTLFNAALRESGVERPQMDMGTSPTLPEAIERVPLPVALYIQKLFYAPRNRLIKLGKEAQLWRFELEQVETFWSISSRGPRHTRILKIDHESGRCLETVNQEPPQVVRLTHSKVLQKLCMKDAPGEREAPAREPQEPNSCCRIL